MTTNNTDASIQKIVDRATPEIYDRSEVFYEKHEGPRLCGCMGAGYDEPYCPCTMGQKGLPMSKLHVKESAAAKERFAKIDWTKWEKK